MYLHLLYDCYAAHLGRETRHPQVVMKELGITYQHSTPDSLMDNWKFWNCENVPEQLPEYMSELKVDPMEYVGYGLNKETAEKIRDYKKA